MSNFFSDVKSWLNADYGGRYFSVILRELIRQQPKILFDLCPNLKKQKYNVEKEFSFQPSRLADLVITESNSSVIHALIEIKHEDGKNDRNHAQIDDYLSFCKKKNIHFLFITKNYPDKNDLQKIVKNCEFAKHLRYSDIFRILEKQKIKSPITEMVRNYLQEESIVFTSKIKKNDVLLLVLKGSNVKHFHGLGKRLSFKGIQNTGNTLHALITNTSLIGQEFHNKYCRDLYKQSPTVSFCFKPQYNKIKAKEDLEDSFYVESEAVDGGKLYISNWYNLKDNKLKKWHGGIEFGFEIILDTTKKDYLKVNLYSEVSFADEYFYEHKSINIERLDESNVFSKIVSLNKIAINKGLSCKDCPRAVKSKLNMIYKSLSE